MKYNTHPLGLRGCLRTLSTSAFLATTLVFASTANADMQVVTYVEDAGAAQRIDSAGKLRMLSQRVVAAGCYVQAGIAPDATTAMLKAATDEFKLITDALEFGNPDLGINGAETDVKTRATLERLHAIWNPIAVIADDVVAGTATQEDIALMAQQSEPLLDMAQRLVSTVTAEYSVGVELVMRDALAIDIAGRQRMLAQRISKDVCLLATGIDTDHAMEDLDQTAKTFDASLSALRGGMPSAGLLAPTNEQVIADLEVAAADWAIVETKISDALAGKAVSDERLAEMFELANTLTADMNKVVVDYADASKQDL